MDYLLILAVALLLQFSASLLCLAGAALCVAYARRVFRRTK